MHFIENKFIVLLPNVQNFDLFYDLLNHIHFKCIYIKSLELYIFLVCTSLASSKGRSKFHLFCDNKISVSLWKWKRFFLKNLIFSAHLIFLSFARFKFIFNYFCFNHLFYLLYSNRFNFSFKRIYHIYWGFKNLGDLPIIQIDFFVWHYNLF